MVPNIFKSEFKLSNIYATNDWFSLCPMKKGWPVYPHELIQIELKEEVLQERPKRQGRGKTEDF